MLKFTNFEMADMHFAYGLANTNSREARRNYAERYRQRNLPFRQICEYSPVFRKLNRLGHVYMDFLKQTKESL